MSDPSCDYCGEDSCLCPPHLKKQDDSWAMVGHHRETAPLDIATDVAASIYAHSVAKTIGEMPNYGDAGDYLSDRCTQTLAGQCVRFGRIFAEAVAKEGK